MNPKDDDPKMVAKMFEWIGPTKFRLINNEGFEKVFDISNGLKSIGYGKVPMLDMTNIQNLVKYHFYNDSKITRLS